MATATSSSCYLQNLISKTIVCTNVLFYEPQFIQTRPFTNGTECLWFKAPVLALTNANGVQLTGMVMTLSCKQYYLVNNIIFYLLVKLHYRKLYHINFSVDLQSMLSMLRK